MNTALRSSQVFFTLGSRFVTKDLGDSEGSDVSDDAGSDVRAGEDVNGWSSSSEDTEALRDSEVSDTPGEPL